ncbi:MAG: hypothetical protein J5594_04655 [Elusimicrobiaceae bacterium]|nr:hypothetical protein [Elusimicrobiaceae bacterium]
MNSLSSKGLNIMLFIERIIFVLAFTYLAAGEALHLNAFIQNGIDIGLPYAHFICPFIVISTLIFCFLILIGFAWKIACFGLMVISLFSGFFFFAGAINKVNIVGVLLSFVILVNFLMLGSGQISVSYWLDKNRKKRNKRLSNIM